MTIGAEAGAGTTRTPTEEQYTAYEAMARYFNARLFDGSLPPALLSFSRRGPRTRGFFAAHRWARGEALTHEISLNPKLLPEHSPMEIAATLVHELCHLWQLIGGTPSRPGYHNREWAEKMEAIGLMPTDTGESGGKRTGQRMSHAVIPGGPFEQAFQAMPPEYLLPWRCCEASAQGVPAARPRPASKVKYRCPGCRQNVWGKPGLSVQCPACQELYVPVAVQG